MKKHQFTFTPGNILAGYIFEDGKSQRKHGHVTIYADNGKFYNWGADGHISPKRNLLQEKKRQAICMTTYIPLFGE